jgi:predicted unusual protein kinase regulating ubiquinone biosynthesis (AarF/ABC1/UbiB family)
MMLNSMCCMGWRHVLLLPQANEHTRAVQLRGVIERLGPAYVKVAQALSTRVDLLSPEYFAQIQMLQDRVPPFPCDQAKEVGCCGVSQGAGTMCCTGLQQHLRQAAARDNS